MNKAQKLTKIMEALLGKPEIEVGTIYTGSCKSSASDTPYRYFYRVVKIDGNKVTLEGHKVWEKFPPFSGDGRTFTAEMNPDGSIDGPEYTIRPM